MSILVHLLITVSYVLFAAAVAVGLPRLAPEVGQHLSLAAGAVVLLASALVHETVSRRAVQRHLADRLAVLGAGQGDLNRELRRARQETRRIYEAIEATSARDKKTRINVDEVVAEVRVLQKLIEQLSARGQQPADGADGEDRRRGIPVSELMPATGLDHDAILDIVREGLRCGRVDLFLQPVVSLPQRRHRFYECFSRIGAEDGSIIVPEQYIPVAEREGLITTIDNMLLFRAVQLIRKTQRHNRDIGFFCNISPHTLADTVFFHDFIEFVAQNVELAPHLVFEFSQATVAGMSEPLKQDLRRLAVLGFRFSMDQVTNLNLDYADLARRHFKFVKIEAGSFMVGMEDVAVGADLRDIRASLDRFGIDLIVEKIESERTLVELLDFPIDFGQGYLFGEPRLSREG